MQDSDSILQHLGIPQDTLQGLGAVTVMWGLAELSMDMLIIVYLRAEARVGQILVNSLTNRARCDVLLGLVEELESDPAVKERIIHGCKMFNRNRENRNALIHSMCFGETEDVQFIVRNRGRQPKPHALNAETITVNKIAQEIDACCLYLNRVAGHIWGRDNDSTFKLPEMPPLPHSLTKRPLEISED